MPWFLWLLVLLFNAVGAGIHAHEGHTAWALTMAFLAGYSLSKLFDEIEEGA